MTKLNKKNKARDQYLRRNYGLGLDDYERLLKAQNGGCAICERSAKQFSRSLAVDHDHRTFKVRGLLCPRCNQGLQYYQDNPEWLQRASDHCKRDTGFLAPRNRKRRRRKKKKR